MCSVFDGEKPNQSVGMLNRDMDMKKTDGKETSNLISQDFSQELLLQFLIVKLKMYGKISLD